MGVPKDKQEGYILLLANKTEVKHRDIYNTHPNSQKLDRPKCLSVVKWINCHVFLQLRATQQWKGITFTYTGQE
jgi:hypothetical protein